jgi:curved DNA-binding protein CbpA
MQPCETALPLPRFPRLRRRRCASPDDRHPLADYYFVLGVPPDATEAELHAAWRRQLKYWHPDRGNHPDALEHAKLINLAREVLTNSTKRAAYDRQRETVGWRPSASAPSYSRPVQWKTVSREGPPRAPKGFDRHGFVARLEEMMNRGRLMIEKRKDLASASKWESQTQALLRDELGDHAYTKRFELALRQPRPEGLVAAYGVLWAAYEDALKGDLKPVVKVRRQS